jgi:hypothetical protein
MMLSSGITVSAGARNGPGGGRTVTFDGGRAGNNNGRARVRLDCTRTTLAVHQLVLGSIRPASAWSVLRTLWSTYSKI